MKSLEGMRIVEVGSVVLGPYGAEVLAEMGAEVIKIEALAGDSTRSMGAMLHSGMGSFFMACNRGKKSVAVNIGTPEGYDALCAIVRTADVFMHNVRFDSAEKIGIGYHALSAMNPRLVYCATYGYGARGRNARRAAYDDVIQAGCGLAALRERIDGIPAYAPTILADKTTALFGVIGIMGALMERMQTGKGKQIEVAMLETMAYFISIEHLTGQTFEPPTGGTGYVRLLSANRRPHRTRDGFLAVMPHNEKQWKKFFTLVGRHDILVDPRFAEPEARARNTDALYEEVGKILPTKTSAEWSDIFTRNDVPYGPVLSLDDLIEDGHMQDVGFWHHFDHPSEGRIRVPAFPVRDGGPDGDATPVGIAPTLGQHSEEVLTQVGYPAEKIAAMLRDGVLVNAWADRRK